MSKGFSGSTSGPFSSKRYRQSPRNEATLSSRRAVGRSVALQKGGSPGSLGCCGAERGREHPQQARSRRQGRAACLFGAGPEQPQREAKAGRRRGERPSGWRAAGRERQLHGLRCHRKARRIKSPNATGRLRSAATDLSPFALVSCECRRLLRRCSCSWPSGGGALRRAREAHLSGVAGSSGWRPRCGGIGAGAVAPPAPHLL